jgi:hypothetical protein
MAIAADNAAENEIIDSNYLLSKIFFALPSLFN